MLQTNSIKEEGGGGGGGGGGGCARIESTFKGYLSPIVRRRTTNTTGQTGSLYAFMTTFFLHCWHCTLRRTFRVVPLSL